MAITTTTALTIAAVAAVAGSAVSAIGAMQQGSAAAAAAEYQAEVQQQQAQQERRVAATEEEDFRDRQKRLMAARRASMGASGVETGAGSPLLAMEDFAAETEMQALRIREGGNIRATRLQQQAALTKAEGRNAKTGSYFAAGSSLLSGIGSGARLIGFGNNPAIN